MNDIIYKSFISATSYLPEKLWRAAYSLSLSQRIKCEEIRLRIGKNAKAFLGDKFVTLTDNGVAPIVSEDDIDYLIRKSTGSSVHTYEDQIRSGFITTKEGHRIGLCGHIVYSLNNIITIKNISSVNIRISKNYDFMPFKLLKYIKEIGLCNILVISKAGVGKTTFLRQIAKALSSDYSISIVDERNEISGDRRYSNVLVDIGDCDVITGGTKYDSINYVLRSMSPNIIVVDEITNDIDAESIIKSSYCGNKLIVSAHCGCIEELEYRPIYKKIMDSNLFNMIVQIVRVGSGRSYRVFVSEECNDTENVGDVNDYRIKFGDRYFIEKRM